MTNNKIVLGIVAGAVVLFGLLAFVFPKEKIIERVVGGATNYDELGIGAIELDVHTGKLGSGVNQAYWANNTGHSVFIDYATLALIGDSTGLRTASSTFRFFVATSTASSVSDNIGNAFNMNPINYRSVMDGWLVATSTTATSTTNIYLANAGVSIDNYGSTTAANDNLTQSGPVEIRQGEYVNIYFKQENPLYCDGLANGRFCEAATSTARGFDVLWMFKTFATTTRPAN